MAQRFGGKHSPSASGAPASGAFEGKTRARAGGRVNVLFLVPLPLAVRAFLSEPVGLALNLAALGVLLLAAWLTREGLLAEEAYNARKIARRPAFPRKIFGSALTGIGLFVAGLAGDGGLVGPVIYGALGTLLHGFAFGLDPLRDKTAEGIDTFQTDRVARAVEEAERHLAAMSEAVRRAGARDVVGRVERFQTTARKMFRTVEDDPRDLTAARKYLGVYLLGARDASTKFADLYSRTKDETAKVEFEALLDDLEQNFAARTERFLKDDKVDLDVEIDVLRDRLARDGLTRN